MSSQNAGKKRAADTGLPYVHCWDCKITWETMLDLETGHYIAHQVEADAEDVLHCPNCNSILPPPLRVRA